MFQGFVELGDSFPAILLVTNSSGTPVNLDALPTYRVYGPNGFISGQSGSTSFRNTGSITGATNASPIVITSASHGLTTGDRVTITGVGGNTAANGTWIITRLDANTFSLNGSTGNGSYTSGGTWNVTGLYFVSLTCSGVNGYEAGESYFVLFAGTASATSYANAATFVVT